MSKKAKELAARYGRNLSVVEIAEKILEEQEQYRVNAFGSKPHLKLGTIRL